ncbi:MAG: proline dehydrogenase family protein [Nitrospiraceae bacterium]
MPIPLHHPDQLEPAIQHIGRRLAAASAGESPTLFDHRRWSRSLLDWAMKDPHFKVQLFRFVDVLPSLTSDEQVARLLEEYFGQDVPLGATLKWGMRVLTRTTVGAKLGARTIRHQVEQMAKTFIAGATVADSGPTLTECWTRQRACSVDLLGEASVSEVEAGRYLTRCLLALDELVALAQQWPAQMLLERDHLGPLPRVQLSIKLTALYSQLDPIDPDGCYDAIAPRLRLLVRRAQSLPAAIVFDMEQAELKSLTLDIFMRLFSEPEFQSFPYAGLALQAYLRDTPADVDRLIRWVQRRDAPILLRLVKGAYWDAEIVRARLQGWPIPLFEQKWETDAQYESLARTLLDHTQWIRPAFGTHNLRTLAAVEAYAQARGLPQEAIEYQMIFGMAEPLQTAVVHLPRRLRLYAPVGALLPGMAYLVRRLLENTSNESFLRKEYVESLPLDWLLAPPAPPSSLNWIGQAPTIHRGNDSDSTTEREPTSSHSPFRNEPLADFSQEHARSAMADALAAVRANFGQQIFYSVAEGIRASGPPLFSHNPAQPDERLGVLTSCSPADVPAAVHAAVRHAVSWRQTPIATRTAILHRAAAIMRERRYDLAAWEILEVGKPWREADADVCEAIDFLEFYAREMIRLADTPRLGAAVGEDNRVRYNARGVAAVIAPWNFPLAIPTGMVAAALVTGNTVLFKPSERALIVGCLLGDILAEAGVPSGVLQLLPGGPDVGRTLAAQPELDIIAFTGSKQVGLSLIERAARYIPGWRHVTRVVAEMGGKNAIIVDDTADLDEAISGVVASFTGYQGQKCSACSRAIVHQAVYDTFLERLSEAVRSLSIGSPELPGTRMGPMIDERAQHKVRAYVEIARREGRIVVERQVDGPGWFHGPVIVADIKPEHRLAQEEIFGPVLAVMRAATFAEALDIANGTEYALTGGVYSRSPANLAEAAERFDVGNLYLNRPITGALVGRQPFGGHRLSGVGAKTGGHDYLAQFSTVRVLTENTMRRGFAPMEQGERPSGTREKSSYDARRS